MVWKSVQRSGRTSIFATTRSLSASVKVTPFSSANGIFSELIFSSGVMRPPVVVCAIVYDLRLLHTAPFRDEQRHRLGRLPQRLQIYIFVEAVDRLAAGAKAQARDIVVE